MFSTNFYKLFKFPVILIILSVLTLGFVCAGMIGHASMHAPVESMNVAVVKPVDDQPCCNTSISKHIESWKSTLLVVPRDMRDGLTLLILGLIVAMTVGLIRFRQPFNDRRLLSYRLYARDNPDLALFNQLKLAFARGILNPKIY